MNRTNRILAPLFAAALLVAPVLAFAGLTTWGPVSSGSSGTFGEVSTEGPHRFNVQACGKSDDAFSGTVVVKQGEKTGKLTTITTFTLTSETGCPATAYSNFDPSGITEVRWTRSSGTLEAVYLRYFP